MDAEFISMVVSGIPSFAGLVYALWVVARQNNRLIEALIGRENCDDEDSN